MLHVEMTPNHLGFKVTGDYDALDELYDAVWTLTVAEDDFETIRKPGTPNEQIMSTRLLALCYDIRHAYQGDRGVELVDSGMDERLAEFHHLPAVEKNVAFSFNVLYPEAMYELMALNHLARRREGMLTGAGTAQTRRDQTGVPVLDPAICTVRHYESRVLMALETAASKGRYARILENVTENYYTVSALYTQWVDIINCDFARMSPKRRLEELSTVVRDMADFAHHGQYQELKADVDKHAEQFGCSREELEVPGLDFPETLKW